MTFVILMVFSAVLVIVVSMQENLKRTYTEGKVKEFKLSEKINSLIYEIRYPNEDEVRTFGYFGLYQDKLKNIFDDLRLSIKPFLIDKNYIDELERKYGRRIFEELERDFRRREFEC